MKSNVPLSDSNYSTLRRSVLLTLLLCLGDLSDLPAVAQYGDQTQSIQSFPVGSAPNDVVFDGASIWVVNTGSDSVTKLRASDGALQGTFMVGSNPFYATFDGANIWVGNFDNASLTKLRASDGMLVGTFTGISSPQALTFDGVNIWVVNRYDNTVSRLRASDGTHRVAFDVGETPI